MELLEDHANTGAIPRLFSRRHRLGAFAKPHCGIADAQRAPRRLFQQVDAAEQRGFAAPAGADDEMRLTSADFQ